MNMIPFWYFHLNSVIKIWKTILNIPISRRLLVWTIECSYSALFRSKLFWCLSSSTFYGQSKTNLESLLVCSGRYRAGITTTNCFILCTVFIIINLAFKYIYCRGPGSVFSGPSLTLEDSISVTIATILSPLRACAAASATTMDRFAEYTQFCTSEKLKHQNRINVKDVKVWYVMACQALKSELKLPAGAAVMPC